MAFLLQMRRVSHLTGLETPRARRSYEWPITGQRQTWETLVDALQDEMA